MQKNKILTFQVLSPDILYLNYEDDLMPVQVQQDKILHLPQ